VNLVADGFAMTIGNYMAVKTQNEFIQRERIREEWEIDNRVDEEKQEVRYIYLQFLKRFGMYYDS
jgi:vacuolar iron transporter family protein